MQMINTTLFAAATSLNAFWILNVAKESYPAVKTFLNFYPVTGPLLGLYLTSFVVFCVFFILARKNTYSTATQYYFVFSVLLFFFAVFPPVYEPIVTLLSGA